MEEGLQIPVSFTLEEARAALKQLEQAARDAGRRAGEGLDLDKPASGGRGGISKLKGQLGQAREGVMFFTAALTELGPAGQVAQRAVSGVAGAFLGGGGLLLGLEAARLAVSLVVDALAATSKEMDEIEQRARQSVEAAKGRVADLQTQILLLREGEEGVARAAYVAERDRLNKEIAELRRRHRTEVMLPGSRTEIDNTIVALERERKTLHQKFLEEIQGIRTVRKERAEAEEERKRADEARKLREEEELDRLMAQGRLSPAPVPSVDFTMDFGAATPAVWEAIKKDLDDVQMRLNAFQYGEPLAIRVDLSPTKEALDALEELRQSVEFTRSSLISLGSDGMMAFSRSVSAEFGKIFRTSRAYERAMAAAGKATQNAADLSGAAFAAMAQDALASVGQEAVVRALYNTALGLSFLALGNTASATQAFQSAAAFTLTAAMAGSAAFAIGQTRGMTKAERGAVNDYASASGLETPGGPREFGGNGASPNQGAATKEWIVVIGDPFETPAETARRAARRLAEARRLDMMEREEE